MKRLTLDSINQGAFIVTSVYYSGGNKARIDGHFRFSTKKTSKWFTVTGIRRVMSDNFVQRWL